MKIFRPYGLLAVLFFFAASPTLVCADEHGDKAHEHLEEAIESGKKGSARRAHSHGRGEEGTDRAE